MNFQVSELQMAYGVLPNQSSEALYALAPRYSCPVGFVWFTQDFGVVNIGYLFVHERLRRNGIATAMLDQLKRWYPDAIIGTEVGNELSTPWLVANGFHRKKGMITGLFTGWFIYPPYSRPVAPALTFEI